MERSRYLEKLDTTKLLEETCTLLQYCWEQGFGKRPLFSMLEVLMCECEARGIEFVAKDEGLVVRIKKTKPIEAKDFIGIPESERWDGR